MDRRTTAARRWVRRLLHGCAAGLCLAAQAHAGAVEPIVVGQSLGLLPPDRGAESVLAGTAAFVEAVNARGGVAGRPLRLITLDDGNVPQRHQDNLRRLVQAEHAVAIVNCVGAEICRAAAAAVADLRVPLIGVHTGSASVGRTGNAQVFRVRPFWDKEADALARQLKALAAFRVALITDRGDGPESLEVLRKACAAHGLETEVLRLAAVTPAGIEDLLGRLGKGRFQAAVLEFQPSAIEAVRAGRYDTHGEWPNVLMTMSSVSLEGLRIGFPNRVIGFTAVVPNPENPVLPLTLELQRRADATAAGGPQALTHAGLESYISMKLLAEAIKRAGGHSEPERITAALQAMAGVDLGGFFITFAKGRASGSDYVDVGLRSRSGALR